MAKAFERLLGQNFLLGLRAKAHNYQLEVPHVEVEETRSYVLAWNYLNLAKNAFTHIYCREEKLLFFILLYNHLWFRLPLTFCYEIHHLVYMKKWWHRYILRHVTRVISITHGIKEALVAEGYSKDNIFVAPDAVDIAMFDTGVGKEDARRTLALPLDKHIVLYTGTIDEPWKGVGTLYDAMQKLDDTYVCLIVGGKPHYVEEFNRLYPSMQNVLLIGHRPHNEIPLYLKAADVLVLPNSAKSETSRIATSPMKLFEYMAAHRPIVASDLPSIREILNEQNALFVTPDDTVALARGIRTIAENSAQGTVLAEQARHDVERYTWDKRAEHLLAFLSQDHA